MLRPSPSHSRARLLVLLLACAGCAQLPQIDPAQPQATQPLAAPPQLDPALQRTSVEDPVPLAAQPREPSAFATPAIPPAPDTRTSPPSEAWSLDQCIQRSLASNPSIHAARLNVESLGHRIPQVTSLDDPVVSHTIYPIPMVAPQYSIMGYMPYSLLLAQQFPWFGTLQLRGKAASQDVQIALAELAATQLETVEAVKRAYADLLFNQRAESLLLQNRQLAQDFLQIARERYRTATASQADLLRAQVALTEIDREREAILQAAGEARAELARLLHLPPDTSLLALPHASPAAVPAELDRLQQLAITARPDLQGRLAVIARDQTAVELARKRYKPNLTLGVAYSVMEERGAVVGQNADGMPNVGLFLGFNLPIYRAKLAAGVCEAQARAAADAALYSAERDQALRDIKALFLQARSLHNVANLLRQSNLPAASQILELTAADYRAGAPGIDLLAVLTATRDLLQLQLQIDQLDAELRKSLASLERAVGTQLYRHPPDTSAHAPLPPPPPQPTAGPFQTTPSPAPSAPLPNSNP